MRMTGDQTPRVLVADAKTENRVSVVEALSSRGMLCLEAPDGVLAWTRFTAERPDLVLAASQLPGLPGLDLLNRVRDVSATPVVLQVPEGNFSAALLAIRRGATDVIPLPCDMDELPSRIQAALEFNPECSALNDAASVFAGGSTASHRVRDQLRALSGLRIPVLFAGEKGTGRDHAAL